MKPSPLWLESHSFRRIKLDVNDSSVPDHQNTLACAISYGQDRDDPLRFRVILNLKLEANDDSRPPYQGEFEIAGVFRVHEKWPKQKVESLISTSGPTLLYGAIREMLINLTSRMEHGPISLRTVSFADSKASMPVSKTKGVKRQTHRIVKAK